MQFSASPSVISERALALSLRLRIAELDNEQHAGIGGSAIPDRLEVPPSTSDAWIYGAYAMVLSRSPDNAGLDAFRHGLESGMEPAVLFQELRRSPEGRGKRANAPTDPRDTFVIGCYLLALGRSPSPAELLEARSSLDHGQDFDSYLVTLTATDDARRSLRFPPSPPEREAALAIAIQRAAGHAEAAEVTARLYADLIAGEPVTHLLRNELRRNARSPWGRLRVRLVIHSLTAHVESMAASLLAQQESALTRDLIWRIQLNKWRNSPREGETPLGQRLSQWYR